MVRSAKTAHAKADSDVRINPSIQLLWRTRSAVNPGKDPQTWGLSEALRATSELFRGVVCA